MKREAYFWMLIVIAILSVSLYFRYLYQPTISIALNISGPHGVFYPYQVARFSINAYNSGGSAIMNMSLGVIINGNLSTLYRVTLPVGKQTTIDFNYTPQLAGAYSVSVVADPARLYNVADRSTAYANASITVSSADNNTPWVVLPAGNISSKQGINLTRAGYVVDSYISNKYNISTFFLTDNPRVNRFLAPLLNVTYLKLRNISVSKVKYANNDSASSVWLKGTMPQDVFLVAADGAGLQANTVSTNAGNTTLIRISNSSTLCEWYAGGWTKMLSYSGGLSCAAALNQTVHANTTSLVGLGSNLRGKLEIKNASLVGNFSGSGKAGKAAYLGALVESNSSFMYASIANNTRKDSTCFGIISNENSTSYCSTYILPISGKVAGTSLIKTTAYINTYNLTLFSLLNTSRVVSQVDVATGILKGFNISGNSTLFKTGFVNLCSFNQSFGCGNVTYYNGTISFSLFNNMSSRVGLKSIKCYTSIPTIGTNLSAALDGKTWTKVTTACYNLGSKLSGSLLDLRLRLLLNYTVGNSALAASGSAFIPFG